MVMTAWSDGVASNWIGFFGLDKAKAYLAIPEPLDLFAIAVFGYPAARSFKGKKKRKPLSEVVHYGRFGNPPFVHLTGRYCPPNNSMELTRPAEAIELR
jgi:hypothetical protein